MRAPTAASISSTWSRSARFGRREMVGNRRAFRACRRLIGHCGPGPVSIWRRPDIHLNGSCREQRKQEREELGLRAYRTTVMDLPAKHLHRLSRDPEPQPDGHRRMSLQDHKGHLRLSFRELDRMPRCKFAAEPFRRLVFRAGAAFALPMVRAWKSRQCRSASAPTMGAIREETSRACAPNGRGMVASRPRQMVIVVSSSG